MAKGTVIVFEEAKGYLLDGGFESADQIKIAIVDNTVTPTAAFASPDLASFNEVGAAGSYVTGGLNLETLGTMVTEAGGTVTFDTSVNPTWAENGSNDTDAWWGIIYNDTDGGKRAIAFVELDGPVDMVAGALTITWNGSGLFTLV